MKELTIEQKVQRYDETIKKLRDFYRDYDTVSRLIDVKEELANLFPELKESDESEDEKMRKGIVKYLEQSQFGEEHYCVDDDIVREYIAWLEKQGEHAKFCDSIQVGDKVTRNEDGVLVNLSQLERVAKPADKVEPKFYEGEWLCENEPNNYARFIQILETVNVQGKERYRISRDIHNDEDIVEFDFAEKSINFY